MTFHHDAELPAAAEPDPASDVASAEWFPLGALPPRSEVAHKGWALSVLRKMARSPAR
jgi:hypothetical protein